MHRAKKEAEFKVKQRLINLQKMKMHTLKRRGETGISPVDGVKHQRMLSQGSGKHSDGRLPSPHDDPALMGLEDFAMDGLPLDPFGLDDPLNSYRVQNNLKQGMDPEENKNTKVTLDLLHNLEYNDIQTGGDGFKPEDVLLPEDMNNNSDDEDSVFNYLFPQGLS